ncbi:hypothetical protein STXM2123_4554 [Streptomyces sp. F-3]|nr:hypothetical protein STXM2123_4554 [Streptomyces sp. F-3]
MGSPALGLPGPWAPWPARSGTPGRGPPPAGSRRPSCRPKHSGHPWQKPFGHP